MANQSTTDGLPTAIARAQESFEHWRATRKSGGERIPDALWTLAMKVARQHGSWRTARALRLDSGALKRRMDAAGGGLPHRSKEGPLASFVELRPAEAGGRSECVVEVEDPAGARLRVRLPEVDGAAIGAMARAFLEGRGE